MSADQARVDDLGRWVASLCHDDEHPAERLAGFMAQARRAGDLSNADVDRVETVALRHLGLCSCSCLMPATHLEPAQWEQDYDCPIHFEGRTCAGPIDEHCQTTTTAAGRHLLRDGVIVGRLCPSCSAAAGEIMAEARAAADDYRDDWR